MNGKFNYALYVSVMIPKNELQSYIEVYYCCIFCNGKCLIIFLEKKENSLDILANYKITNESSEKWIFGSPINLYILYIIFGLSNLYYFTNRKAHNRQMFIHFVFLFSAIIEINFYILSINAPGSP